MMTRIHTSIINHTFLPTPTPRHDRTHFPLSSSYHSRISLLHLSIDFCYHYCCIDLWFICGTIEICSYDSIHHFVASRYVSNLHIGAPTTYPLSLCATTYNSLAPPPPTLLHRQPTQSKYFPSPIKYSSLLLNSGVLSYCTCELASLWLVVSTGSIRLCWG